jgi:hypothetical protein
MPAAGRKPRLARSYILELIGSTWPPPPFVRIKPHPRRAGDSGVRLRGSPLFFLARFIASSPRRQARTALNRSL